MSQPATPTSARFEVAFVPLVALMVVLYSAIAFTFYFFIFFYPTRLLIGANGWKLSETGARRANYAALCLPFACALIGFQGGSLVGLLVGVWIGSGLAWWLLWALQDALPAGAGRPLAR